MVFNTTSVISVARVSATAWQVMACLPERLSSDQLLELVICFPLQQLSRLALCFWTVCCFTAPYPNSYHRYYYPVDADSSSSSSSTSDDNDNDDDEYRYYYYSGLLSD